MMRLGDAELRHRTSHDSHSKLVRPVVESKIPSSSHDVSIFYPSFLTCTDLARRVECSGDQSPHGEKSDKFYENKLSIWIQAWEVDNDCYQLFKLEILTLII
jgi:hypothetical protein